MKHFFVNLEVKAQDGLSEQQVLETIQRLINAGLEDARATIEACEGDTQAAQTAVSLNIGEPVAVTSKTETSVKVRYWDDYNSAESGVNTHQFDIDDQRETNGQAYITIGANEGNVDDMLSITMEVQTNPLDHKTHVPCAHVHFDGSNLAMSLYKIGNKILLRPESQVCFRDASVFGAGHFEQFFWIEN